MTSEFNPWYPMLLILFTRGPFDITEIIWSVGWHLKFELIGRYNFEINGPLGRYFVLHDCTIILL
jgi:hypothetical protein